MFTAPSVAGQRFRRDVESVCVKDSPPDAHPDEGSARGTRRTVVPRGYFTELRARKVRVVRQRGDPNGGKLVEVEPRCAAEVIRLQ